MDADLVVWDPESGLMVRGSSLEHRHPITPYEGRRLLGRIGRTYVRGKCAYANGAVNRAPSGRLLHL